MSKVFDSVGSDWARHLKPRGKRTFWRKVRHKIKHELRLIRKNKDAK